MEKIIVKKVLSKCIVSVNNRPCLRLLVCESPLSTFAACTKCDYRDLDHSYCSDLFCSGFDSRVYYIFIDLDSLFG